MRLKSDQELIADAMAVLGLKSGDKMTDSQIISIKAYAWSERRKQQAKAIEDLKGPQPMVTDQVFSVGAASESPIEGLLMMTMNTRSLLIGEFEQQVNVGPYRLDFAFKKIKLYVEADGRQHFDDPGQMEHDRRRHSYLARLGWTALRFPGRQIYTDPYACVDEVCRVVEKLSSMQKVKEAWE